MPPEDESMALIVLLALAVALYVAVRIIAGPPDDRLVPSHVPNVPEGAAGVVLRAVRKWSPGPPCLERAAVGF